MLRSDERVGMEGGREVVDGSLAFGFHERSRCLLRAAPLASQYGVLASPVEFVLRRANSAEGVIAGSSSH